MTKKFKRNDNSSTNDKRKLAKKQHSISNVDYVNTVTKMLTISTAPATRCPLGII